VADRSNLIKFFEIASSLDDSLLATTFSARQILRNSGDLSTGLLTKEGSARSSVRVGRNPLSGAQRATDAIEDPEPGGSSRRRKRSEQVSTIFLIIHRPIPL